MNKTIFFYLMFIMLFFLANLNVVSPYVTDNYETIIVWQEQWENSQSLTDWQIRADTHPTEFGNYSVSVSSGHVRLEAISNASTLWYGTELKSNEYFNLSQEWLRVSFSFLAPAFNYSNRYAFTLCFWNGTFEDVPVNYAFEYDSTHDPLYFRVETVNETHANYQIPLQWNQTTNPLPYSGGLTTVVCVMNQNSWNWYVNSSDFGTGFIGGLEDGPTMSYVYLALEEYGNVTTRYVDFYGITVESYKIGSTANTWDFNPSKNWTMSESTVLNSNASFPIFNDPSIIKHNDTYYMAFSLSNGTYSECQIRNSSDCFSFPQQIAVIPDSVKPWLSDKQDDGYFYIFYSVAGGHINRSRSPDLISWTSLGYALSPTSNEWDASGTWAPYLIYKDPLWYLFYYGANTSYVIDRIGLATASVLDGFFSKYANNPIMAPTNMDSFLPEFGCLSSTVIAYGGYYYNFYNSYTLKPTAIGEERGLMTINVARSLDLFTWDRLGYPIIQPNNLGWDWKTLIGSSAYITLSYPEGHYLFVNAFNQSSMENIGYFFFSTGYVPWLPFTFIMGMAGLGAMFFGSTFLVVKIREKEYKKALITGTVAFLIGFGFFLGWLIT